MGVFRGFDVIARFGPCEVDSDRRQLLNNGVEVHLTPKAFDLLALLIGEAPRVVRKDELHKRLWADTFVSDATLVGLIKELRRALRDHDAKAPIIRTAHGVGYAFAAHCQHAVASPPTLQTTGDVATAAAKTEIDGRSIAVLPFANMSADPDSEYFSDGLAEELINALTHLPGLRVASRTSAFRFRGRDVDIKEIGRALRVATVLEGSVRRLGHRLRVTAQLTNVADGYHRWAERYDREIADVFEIQDDIVASIVKALAPALLGEAKAAVTRPTDNLEAYELYLKGRQYRQQGTPTMVPLAIRSFEQAVALDSGYALAYAGLADCYTSLRFTCLSDAMIRPRAEAPLTRAMALDSMRPEVQVSQGLFILIFERAWRQAEPHFRRAIELNPGWSLAHIWYGFFLGMAYRHQEASAQVTVALDLDPLSPYVHASAAVTLLLCRAYRDAERLARQALELQPDYYFGLHVLAVVLSFADRAAEAIPFVERLVALSSRLPIYVGLLGAVYGAAGRTADLVRLEHELEERRRLGEYITPVIRFQFAYGRRDRGLITRALEDCLADNMPFASLWSVRRSLDAWRTEDPAINELLLRLGDDVR